MEVVDALHGLGGSARWRDLRGHVGWRALKRARASDLVSCRNGVWTLVGTARDQQLATELGGVRSHVTAAAHWCLAIPPESSAGIRLTLPPKSHLRRQVRDLQPSYRRLGRHERVGNVTTPLRTVVDCLRDESLRVALSVGDSALRQGLVQWDELVAEVTSLRGKGAGIARRRVMLLDARAANAFESCARAILVEAGLAGFVPQVEVLDSDDRLIGRVDLAHVRLRIVVECDGYEHHGGRQAFVRDLVRFTCLVSAGWRPLRFTWEQVMFQADWVAERVRTTMDLAAAGARTPDQGAARPASRVA